MGVVRHHPLRRVLKPGSFHIIPAGRGRSTSMQSTRAQTSLPFLVKEVSAVLLHSQVLLFFFSSQHGPAFRWSTELHLQGGVYRLQWPDEDTNSH